MGFSPRFPGRQDFAPLVRAAALLGSTLNSYNSRWAVTVTLPDKVRAAPPTLRPRKGPTPAQPTVAAVIGHFLRSRDMLQLDQSDVDAIGQTIMDGIVADVAAGKNLPPVLVLMTRFATLAKGLWVHRWERGGDGLPLAPLSPKWLARKRRLGKPAAIGQFTGQSLKALKSARVFAKKL